MTDSQSSGRALAGNGDAILSQRARPRVVFQLISVHGLAISLLTAIPAIAAAAEGAWRLAAALGAAAVPPVIAFALQRNRPAVGDPRQIEALVAVAAAFSIGALLATPGFMALGLGPLDALFEAVSGVTTTGLSVAGNAAEWPQAGHFLRAWLQWVGGFAFAALALALVLGPGVVARRLGLVEAPGEDLLGSTRTRARAVLGAYLALTVVACIACAVSAGDLLEGVMIALAAVSTGGFAPQPESVGGYGAVFQSATALAMMAGAVSMTLYAQAWRKGIAVVLGDRELRVLLALAAAASLGVVLVELLRPGGVGPGAAVFTVLSAQSTAGFSAVPVSDHAPASLVLLIGVMVIGGSLGATAGGIKVFRFVFVASAARMAILRTALSPNAVSHLRVFGRRTDEHEGTDALGLIVLYFASVGLVWFGFVASGHAALPALFDTVSAFSTVGLSTGLVGPDLSAPLKAALCLAMLLGRLEFLAVLALVRPATWLR